MILTKASNVSKIKKHAQLVPCKLVKIKPASDPLHAINLKNNKVTQK